MTEAQLLDAARSGDEGAFEAIVATYRRELFVHSYRMLGSPHDAEDALQDALIGAWRGLHSFEGRASLRGWLYKITTNACLRYGSRRPRRLTTPDYCPPLTDPSELGAPVPGPVWMEPLPDDLGEPDDRYQPETRYLRRESVELAYVAAMQHLPATQRAVLILREVLAFPAAEVAAMLETTPASVNSALQRARATLAERAPARSQRVELDALGVPGRRELVDAFVSAWERADVAALLALLTDDARFTMPPLPAWFLGREAIARFVEERMFATAWRLVPWPANGQLAFACYQAQADGATFLLGAVNVLGLRDGRVAAVDGFVDPAVLAGLAVPLDWTDAKNLAQHR